MIYRNPLKNIVTFICNKKNIDDVHSEDSSLYQMRHFLLISAFVFLCCATLHAQNRYFPLRGKVVSADSLSPIPNVHILSEISYYGTTSDFDGRFSMQKSQYNSKSYPEFIQSFQQERKIEKKIRKEQKKIWGRGRMALTHHHLPAICTLFISLKSKCNT